jgi:hypothetical protein
MSSALTSSPSDDASSSTRAHPPPPRELLERMRRDVLVRVLAPHRPFLEARGAALEALAATAQDDLSLVSAVHALLASDAAEPPAALLEVLAALAAVACDAGHERLRMLDRDKQLPQGRLGHETLAAIAMLDFPALFGEVKVAAKRPGATALVEFPAKANRRLPPDPARWGALGRAMASLFAERGRPDHCEPLVTRGARETVIDFVFGRLPQTSERLTESNARTQSTDVWTQRTQAFFEHATGNLHVSGYEFVREGIRRLMGEHLFGDAEHFQRCDLYSLDALEEDLEGAIAPDVERGVAGVELRELYLRRGDGALSTYAHSACLLSSSVAGEIREAFRAGAKAEHVKLALRLVDRKRFVRVEITPPRRLDVPRGDEAVLILVRDLLVHRRLLREAPRTSVVVPPAEEQTTEPAERAAGATTR